MSYNYFVADLSGAELEVFSKVLTKLRSVEHVWEPVQGMRLKNNNNEVMSMSIEISPFVPILQPEGGVEE
jgi:hypothetical protein